MTQAWLNRRYAGLTPQSFVHGVFTFSVEDLRPPPLFNEAWCAYDAITSVVQPEVLQQYEAILIFSSPCNQDHMTGLRSLITALNELGEIPPVFWVPHTIVPEERSEAESIGVYEGNFCVDIMEFGLDDIIHGEPEGINLVVAVSTRIQTSMALARMLNEVIGERRTKSQTYFALENAIHDILWCQVLVRCAPAVPPIDFNLPSGELRSVPGYNFGAVLGRGSFCTVYRLLPVVRNDAAAGEEEVIKLVTKSRLKEPERIMQLGRMVGVMVMLNESWKHPNITSLTAIYHTPTHLCFCETYGGPENLFHWLCRLHSPSPKAQPVAFERVASLITQLGSAVAFIHTGPRVCHLDIKPENVIVNDVPNAISLKLTDFDLAVVQKSAASMCRRCCGTLPFIAPEVLSGAEYDGMAADVWSEGMVIFEMQCGVRVIDRILGLRHAEIQGANQVNSESRKRIAGMIRECFEGPESAGQHLQQHSCLELQRSVPTLRPLFDGIFSVQPEQRLKAQHVADAIAAGIAAEPRP